MPQHVTAGAAKIFRGLAAIMLISVFILFAAADTALAALAAPKDPFSPIQSAQVWSAPQFSWGPVTGAAKYRLDIATDSALSNVVMSYPNIRNSSILPPDNIFTDGTTYYWAVWASTEAGAEGARSPIMSFKRKFVTPTGATPADGSTVRELPTFAWNDITNAFQYEFELCSASDCSEVIYSATVSGNRLTPPVHELSGLPEQLLYWRVRWVEGNFLGGAGETSLWSAIHPFTNNFGYGLSTSVSTPASGVTADVIPAFSWSHFSGASTYELVIAADSLLDDSRITQDGIPNNSVTPADDYGLAAGTYYWAITPYDAEGNPGPRSAVRSFNYTGLPAGVGTLPTAPVVVSPAEGASSSDSPSLTWSPLDGADRYDVELSASSGFSPVLASRTTLANSITATNTLLSNDGLYAGTYYWRVRGVDGGGVTGDWSAARSFIKEPIPAPALTAPADGSTVTTGSVLLDWEPVAGIGQYEVYLSNSPLFASDSMLSATIVAASITGNYYTTLKTTSLNATDEFDRENLLAPGTWYWKVVGLDALGVPQAESATRSFIKPNYAAPVISSPATGSLSSEAPVLKWKGIAGIGLFDVQIGTSTDFTDVDAKRIPANSITAAPDLDHEKRLANRTWYWRVRAVDGDLNEGSWSATRSLTRYRGLYQDSSTSIYYAARKEESSAGYVGSWTSSLSASHSKGRAKASSARNASVAFSFSGSKITLLGMKGKTGGKAKIYVDGVYKTTIDTYSSATKYQQALYSKSGLSGGYHKLKIVVTRTKNASAGGYQLIVDGIDYPSSWTASSKSSFWGGTSRVGTRIGQRANLTFSGNGVAWYASKGPTYGKAEVFIDGVSKGKIDLYAGSPAYKKALYKIEGLAWGTHKISIAVLGQKSSSASGTSVPLDALITY